MNEEDYKKVYRLRLAIDTVKEMDITHDEEEIQHLRDLGVEIALTLLVNPAISSAPRRADASPRQ